MRFWMILAAAAAGCSDKDNADSAAAVDDTGGGGEVYPCEATYFPGDLITRSYTYEVWLGRFQQILSTETITQEFLGLVDLDDGITGCMMQSVGPWGGGVACHVLSVGDGWVYLHGDGDDPADSDLSEMYLYEEPVPLIPLDPIVGEQEYHYTNYIYPGLKYEVETELEYQIQATDESITVEGITYSALKMTWAWDMLSGLASGKERYFRDYDITAYYDAEAGLVRMSWYDAEEDESASVEFQGY